jgi:hypothetical protein
VVGIIRMRSWTSQTHRRRASHAVAIYYHCVLSYAVYGYKDGQVRHKMSTSLRSQAVDNGVITYVIHGVMVTPEKMATHKSCNNG